MGFAYHQLKRYDKAIIFHERSLSLANEANYHNGIATAFAGIAEEYVSKTLFKMAQKYFERAYVCLSFLTPLLSLLS